MHINLLTDRLLFRFLYFKWWLFRVIARRLERTELWFVNKGDALVSILNSFTEWVDGRNDSIRGMIVSRLILLALIIPLILLVIVGFCCGGIAIAVHALRVGQCRFALWCNRSSLIMDLELTWWMTSEQWDQYLSDLAYRRQIAYLHGLSSNHRDG